MEERNTQDGKRLALRKLLGVERLELLLRDLLAMLFFAHTFGFPARREGKQVGSDLAVSVGANVSASSARNS